MNHEDYDSKIDPCDPKYIRGIYNYCDRWCERCPFTAKCSVFDMEQEMEEQLAARNDARDDENAVFWKNLETVFAQTRVVIHHIPDDEPDPEMERLMEEEATRDEEMNRHPLSTGSFTYAKLADAWFEEHAPLIPDESDPNLTPTERSLADAASVIGWYQFQIYVKLRRALDRDDLEEELAADGIPRDSDGSAKVALIGMDRSIAAWARIGEHLPAHAGQAMTFMARLDKVRRLTEQEFPEARAFQRPGFDTDEHR